MYPSQSRRRPPLPTLPSGISITTFNSSSSDSASSGHGSSSVSSNEKFHRSINEEFNRPIDEGLSEGSNGSESSDDDDSYIGHRTRSRPSNDSNSDCSEFSNYESDEDSRSSGRMNNPTINNRHQQQYDDNIDGDSDSVESSYSIESYQKRRGSGDNYNKSDVKSDYSCSSAESNRASSSSDSLSEYEHRKPTSRDAYIDHTHNDDDKKSDYSCSSAEIERTRANSSSQSFNEAERERHTSNDVYINHDYNDGKNHDNDDNMESQYDNLNSPIQIQPDVPLQVQTGENKNVNAPTKRLIKIKVWDEHEYGTSHANSSTIITVEVDIPTKSNSTISSDEITDADATLGIGQIVQIHQRDISSDGHEQLPLVEILQSSIMDKEIHTNNNKTDKEPQSPPVINADGPTQLIPTKSLKKTKKKEINAIPIPTIQSCTIVKSSPSQKMGLAFRKSKGVVIIEKISPGSAFDGTELKPGHECLCINGMGVKSARKAAEIVRETPTTLTILVSTTPCPPGTSYTIITPQSHASNNCGDEAAGRDANSSTFSGMTFELSQELVKLTKIDGNSSILTSSVKVGDYILAINGIAISSVKEAVYALSEADSMIPILYLSMRQLRMNMVDKVMDEQWKREWNDTYEECVVIGEGDGNPLTLRFVNETCVLIDPLREFRSKFGRRREEDVDEGSSSISEDHPLNLVVERLNGEIEKLLEGIRLGVCEG